MPLTIIIIVLAIVIPLAIWKIKKMDVPPDPWEGERMDMDDDDLGVCVNCAAPIRDAKQHYCPKCGNVTGEYTRYIPFVNIKFNYSIFGTIVRRMKRPSTTKENQGTRGK